ncbi:MAG: carboxy terminal-processing peptidase [Prosthecobacter sp.]|jgi:carboxyl-terminal processing protease|uniref:carboxy terminal-processing peptidase n=1 Tax=Prosthecobacter sp. TaxID=1965333 RepID=UPI001A0FC125|nr:carboxy terminal-processing peptidase [Prosthecobacter sp.]MBE2283190.1 carboxy terminal-processing peptidase [Prosthecobacter sp.]
MNRSLFSHVAAAAAAFALSTPPAHAETNFGQVAMHVAYMLQNHHYSKQDFDDKVSSTMLQNYLNMLDFKHIFFTQKDVDDFKDKYDTTLDDHVLMRNISPALEIYDIYKERVKDRVEFLKKSLETHKFTFDSKRTIQIKRDKAPWPKDKGEQDKVWLDIIEDNLLAERLVDEARARDEKKKAEKAAAKKDGTADVKSPAKVDVAAGTTKPEVQNPDTPKTPGLPATAPKIENKPSDAAKVPVAPKVADAGDAKPKEKDEKDMTPKERVLKDYDRLLESIEENDSKDVVNFFLSSLATAYDPHTEYMSTDESDNFKIHMSHKLVGIGALLGQKENDGAEIQGIVVGGPADKQGELKLNDRIVAVAQGDDEFVDVKYMKLQKIVDMIRGEKGTTVRIKIVPADDPSANRVIAIVRDEVPLKEKLANAEMLVTPPDLGKPLKVGWINLSNFYADMENGTVSTSADVERLLRRLMKEKIDGLVLDLRDNGGGSLDEAIKLTGLFVPAGPVVQAKDWRGSISWRDCENEKPVYDGPMIVLTNKASASASEILAAALQDYRRALIVGDESTFGKGTVQTILPVERYMPFFSDKKGAGDLKVTIQKFYRIAGGSTQLKGVEADIKLPSIRDVLDIGEASAENPLPYDTIPPRKYPLFRKNPFPVDEINARVKSRLAANPEFQYIVDESKRLKDKIDRNTVTLNLEEREKERIDTEARRDKQTDEREKRAKEVADRIKDNGFKIYHLTLDNVDKPELVPHSAFTKEMNSGMRTAAAKDDEGGGDSNKFPYGVEPVKLETIHILRDLIELDNKPTTASKGDGKAQADASKAQ